MPPFCPAQQCPQPRSYLPTGPHPGASVLGSMRPLGHLHVGQGPDGCRNQKKWHLFQIGSCRKWPCWPVTKRSPSLSCVPHLPALVAEKSQGPQLTLGLVCTQERVEVPLDGPGPGQHSAWSSHYALAPWAVWGGVLVLGGAACECSCGRVLPPWAHTCSHMAPLRCCHGDCRASSPSADSK